ncbi:MAG: glycosyltransferase family 4 protein [Sphingobium sp.]|uniref:glycosyltransferase family 4 protein n=1 Tax=Sphingobium sp. TaxID=1912891 RepID=UPI0029B3A646|nr:glycosyltransferase family 4 protein [Sphingobium sp.]MDX3911089.1 glycosyltransferase family 4 protein [Sphingobium sp.]
MTADAVGGVWQYATDLAACLQPLGYETTLAVLGPQPTAAQRGEAERIPGLTMRHVPAELDWLAKDAQAIGKSRSVLAAIARELAVDLVQVNSPAFIGSDAFAVPVIGVMHSCVGTWWAAMDGGEMHADFAWRTSLIAEGLANASAVVAPSRAFADAVQRRYSLKHKPHVVHNGRIAPLPRQAAMHDCAVTIGRLWDGAKNARVMDAAAARLSIPFKAIGATSRPNGEAVELNHMHVVGQRDSNAVANCLAARPVFVSVAKYEPFGLAVLEAAEAGCALVLSDIPTFRELWDGAATFVDPDDAGALTSAIEATICDVPARQAAGERARKRASHFTAQSMAGGMDAIYRGVLQQRAAA